MSSIDNILGVDCVNPCRDRHQSSRPDKDKKKSKKKGRQCLVRQLCFVSLFCTGTVLAEDVEDADVEDADDEALMRKMGFGGFITTKGKQVDGNDVSASNIKTKNRYR